MRYANKLTVVPFKEAISNPQPSYLSSLDQQMKNVVNSNAKADEKIKLYNQLLENFLIQTQQNEAPPEVPQVQPVQRVEVVQKPSRLDGKVLKDLQKALTRINKNTNPKSYKKINNQSFRPFVSMNESPSNFNSSHLALHSYFDKANKNHMFAQPIAEESFDDNEEYNPIDFSHNSYFDLVNKRDLQSESDKSFTKTPKLSDYAPTPQLPPLSKRIQNSSIKALKTPSTKSLPKNNADKSISKKSNSVLAGRTRLQQNQIEPKWDQNNRT
jgi:hypothetical protein